jgi:phage gpG-like protein
LSVQYTDKSEAFLKKLEAAADVAVGYAAERLVQGIQDTMPGQGAAKVGVGKDAVYTPSNPGTGPGVRTNTLKGSITSVKTGQKMQRAVGTATKYARIHEKGGSIAHPGGTDYIVTDDGPRFLSKEKALELRTQGKWVGVTGPHQITMPPRPFMSPGLEASKKGMLAAFKRSMGRAFK